MSFLFFMAKKPIKTWGFSLVVVRKGHRFLAVQEAKRDCLWYFPAGRVERGESYAQAAVRETLEEAGVPVILEGILRIEHSAMPSGEARQRVFYVARPADDTPPKSHADNESIQARWVTVEELAELPLRGREVLDIFRSVLRGAPVYPMSLMCREGEPWG